jgi:glycosyltransferase involved in cell wall biosynthesis
MKKRVLIAHQSTIPHYRIPFYAAVERLKPDWWEFRVVYDPRERERKLFFKDDVDATSFQFHTQTTSTFVFNLGSKRIAFQPFLFKARQYDMLVLEQALKNISYPLAILTKLLGKKVVYWGHAKDFEFEHPGIAKQFLEAIKISITRSADGFFAYTKGVAALSIANGCRPRKVFCLNNTVDIESHRKAFCAIFNKRTDLRSQNGFTNNDHVLLYVGRLNSRKRLDLLFDAFEILRQQSSAYRLVIVGSGDLTLVDKCRKRCGEDSVIYVGSLIDPALLAQYYVISDAFVFPGDVGLGPLQSLCYDLTPIVIDSPTNNPEYEYLNDFNSVIVPRGANAAMYGKHINLYFQDEDRRTALRQNAWGSIVHLTIDNMANNFIKGVNEILKS